MSDTLLNVGSALVFASVAVSMSVSHFDKWRRVWWASAALLIAGLACIVAGGLSLWLGGRA